MAFVAAKALRKDVVNVRFIGGRRDALLRSLQRNELFAIIVIAIRIVPSFKPRRQAG